MYKNKIFISGRLVMFARDPASEALPTPEPYEKVESLHEAWATLQAAFAEADKRLKRIVDTYLGDEGNIPPDLRSEYETYKKERDEIEMEIKKLEQRDDFSADTSADTIDDATQRITEDTLSQLDKAFAAYIRREKEISPKRRHDPLFAPAFSEGQKTRHVTGRVSVEDKPIPLKKTPGESPEYSKSLYRNIVRKLISIARGNEKTLSIEEKTAAMLMKGGETRTVVVKGVAYQLERDMTGKFLRLRDYWEDQEKEDPSIASSGSTGTPRWNTVSRSDLASTEKRKREEAETNAQEAEAKAQEIEAKAQEAEAEAQKAREKNFEEAKEELSAEIEGIFSEETTAGSTLHFTDAAVFGPVAENGRKWEVRTQIELKKRYGGSVEARFLKQEVDIFDDGTEGPPQTLSDETVIYRDSQMEACREKIVPDSEPTLQFAVFESNPEEIEAERMAYINRQLDWMSGNLARASMLSWPEKTVRNTATGREATVKSNPSFIQWIGHIQKLIDKENVTDWEQDPTHAFADRHILIRNGLISVLELNEKSRKPKDNEEGEAEALYAAVEKDWRLDESQLPPDLPESLRLV